MARLLCPSRPMSRCPSRLCQLLAPLYFLSSAVVAAPTDDEPMTLADTFLLQQRYGSACLEITTSDLDAGTCVHQDPDDSSKCYPRNRAVLTSCNGEKAEQLWTYRYLEKKVRSSAYPDSMCLSRMVDSVELWPCTSGIPGQLWTFDQFGLLSSAVDKDGRGSYLHLLKGDNVVIQPLQFKYLYYGQWQCFLNPSSNEQVCDKSAFGDNVIWLPGNDDDDQNDDQNQDNDDNQDGDQNRDDDKNQNDDQKQDDDNNQDDDQGLDDDSPNGDQPQPEPVTWEDKPDDLYWLSDRLTNDLRLSVRETQHCLGLDLPEECESGAVQGELCYVGSAVVVKPCAGEDRVWRYDLTKRRIFNKLSGYSYCLTWLNDKLSLQGCFAGGAPMQKWYFSRKERNSNVEYKRLRYFSPRKKYDYLNSLVPPALPSWQDFEVEYFLVPRTSPTDGCGLDPVTGKPLTSCL